MKSLFAIHSEIRAEVGSLEEVLDKRKLPLLFYFVLSAWLVQNCCVESVEAKNSAFYLSHTSF